ncbi:MAG TPA: 50S ribosomal protein L5 [Oligoflexia bacterium]|mgnify:CR=1 FL=1|nr:50S ribosomal protein L5 [Oligoflexia bacterium]
MARLKSLYEKEIVPQLCKEFGYGNMMEVPRLEKIVVNMGVGREATQNSKIVDIAAEELARITGQKPVIRKARKSIANFKLRQGMSIGTSVTLRRERMYEFMDRFITIALPRVRDFKGISRTAFDGRGNYSVGLAEQTIFPEVDIDKAQIRGLNITFVTTAKTNREGEALLEKFGFPFRGKPAGN